jgi:HEAT repeat protein
MIEGPMARAIPAIAAAVTAMVLVCSCTHNAREYGIAGQTQSLAHEVQKRYADRRWDRRQDAIALITAFLSRKPPEERSLLSTAAEYSRLADQLVIACSDTHSSVRIESLKALALAPPVKAFNRISELALHDPNDNARWYALKALAQYRNDKTLDVFIRSYASNDWVLREASVRGMLMLNQEALKKTLTPIMVRAIEDPNESVSATALADITLRNPQIYRAISRVFMKKPRPTTNYLIAVMRALDGFILEDNIRKRVIDYLNHSNRDVRILALRVLKKEAFLRKLSGAEPRP